MLSIGLLGSLTISVDHRRIQAQFGPSARRMVAYLAQYSGRLHRRERLADLFWVGMELTRARSALNTALWRLRKVLSAEPRSKGGSNLVTLGDEVVLESAEWFAIDTHRFDEHAKLALRVGEAEGENVQLAALEAAVRLYSGYFFDGEDGEWILIERERLHSLYVRVAQALARNYAGRNRYDEAIEILRSVLAFDQFREGSHRDLLIMLVLNGQRPEALRTHDRWCVMVQRELGIRPMPRTVELVALIRSDSIFERLDEVVKTYLGDLVNKGRYGNARPGRAKTSGGEA